MADVILGISSYYHDSAAALIINGEIIAAAQEERFSRIKNDASFPIKAVQYVLQEGAVSINEVTQIVFYDKPLLKFERLLETYHVHAPRGLRSFLKAMPIWMNEKLFMKRTLLKQLQALGKVHAPIHFTEHHLAHAASAFYPSPFEESAILTIDGVGEWATTTMAHGRGNKIRTMRELHFPHSLGLLYSSFTYYLGFKVNNGEFKLMGLAPYGDRNAPQTKLFIDKILTELIILKQDGSFKLKMNYFNFSSDLLMTNNTAWQKLFGLEVRKPESEIRQEHNNLAAAIQYVTEEIVFRLTKTIRSLIPSENLVMAGGVALNCVANGKILRSGLYKNIWIQPAAGDAGGALGAALTGWYVGEDRPRKVKLEDSMCYGYLGPSFTNDFIERVLKKYNLVYNATFDEQELASLTAEQLANGKVVGWFQDRMEFGPRALGNRSILADPRNKDMQQRLNLKIKKREGFRPFAPSVLKEDAGDYFDLHHASPYMLFTAPVKKERCIVTYHDGSDNALTRINTVRSDIPSVTHLDYSARIQTVSEQSNRKFWLLLSAFKRITGYSVLINTSFNVRGEPIVCTPQEAVEGFIKTEMDFLIIGKFLVDRTKQDFDF